MMAEAEPSVKNPTPSPSPDKTTKKRTTTRPTSNNKKKKKSVEDAQKEEGIKDDSNDDSKEKTDLKCVETKSIADQDWKPLVVSNEEDERMLALQVVIEHVSIFDRDRKQHFLFLPYKLPLRNLTHTVLHKVGFRNLNKYTLEGRLQIGVLKPLPFSTVTDNLDDTIGHLLMSIISSVILYIKVKKMATDTNEEERLEYREIPLLRGTGYLISDYFYVCDRQSDRKDILYLRCSRQRKGDCSSRAKIIRELGCAVLVNKNHNHPAPNLKMHEFMHRCRNESREPKNFTRHLKDVYHEIREDILSKCSPDELAEAQDALQDWNTVKKIMQKCRSRAVCANPRPEVDESEDCEQSDQSTQNNNIEKTKRLIKLENCKTTNTAVDRVLSRPEVNSVGHNFVSLRNTAIYQGIPPVTATQITHMGPGGVSLPSSSGVPMMVHSGTVDGEALPVGPIPLIEVPSIPHQGFTSNYHMNSNWTTTADNFMLNVHTSNTN